MIKLSFLEFIRTPIKSTVLILIFAASFTMICFVVNYKNYIQSNITEIDKSFTTVAVPNIQVIDNFLPSLYKEENGYSTHESDFYLSLWNFAKNSENGKLDNCELLRGVCNNVTPVLSGTFDPLEYSSEADTPCNSSAFIVTAMDIEYYPKLFHERGIVNSGGSTDDSAHYVIQFRVDETILLNPCYQTPIFIYVSSGAFTQDLRSPFEYGKQYFISGVYDGVDVIQKERDNGTPFPDTYLDLDENSVSTIFLDGSCFNIFTNITGERESPIIKDYEISGEATTVYTYSDKELSQICVPYNGNMDKLQEERPDIIQRIDNAKINANSIYIRTTNNLNSVLYFNQGKASIMAGRNFTEKELLSGAPVCVVSERFATYNNLKVGDSVSVDLYNANMRRMSFGVWLMNPYHDMLNPLMHDKEISRGSLELTVVGIYITQLWEYTAYSLNYNTIFIPSNAVPVKIEITLPNKTDELNGLERYFFSRYSAHMIPSLFVVIIPNNKLEDFKAEAEEAGLGDYFIYNDQGYASIIEVLPVIASSTHSLVIAAFVGFLSVFTLYLVLLPRKLHELGMLISLGAKRKDAIISAVFGWLVLFAPALLLCYAAVMFFGKKIAVAVMNYTMEQIQFNDAFSVGGQNNTVDLTSRFSSWTNNYMTTAMILLGVLALHLLTALIVNVMLSRKPVLTLMRSAK